MIYWIASAQIEWPLTQTICYHVRSHRHRGKRVYYDFSNYTKWDAHEMNTDILFSLITKQILPISYTSPLVSSMSSTVLSNNIEYNTRLQLNILIQQVWKYTCSELHYSKLTRQSTCKWCRAVVIFVFRYSFARETGQWNALWDIVCQLPTYIPQIPETELKTIITSPFRKKQL